MLITALEKERKELFEKGIEKAHREGYRDEDANIMLTKGWTISDISEITGLSEEQILKLKSKFKL